MFGSHVKCRSTPTDVSLSHMPLDPYLLYLLPGSTNRCGFRDVLQDLRHLVTLDAIKDSMMVWWWFDDDLRGFNMVWPDEHWDIHGAQNKVQPLAWWQEVNMLRLSNHWSTEKTLLIAFAVENTLTRIGYWSLPYVYGWHGETGSTKLNHSSNKTLSLWRKPL